MSQEYLKGEETGYRFTIGDRLRLNGNVFEGQMFDYRNKKKFNQVVIKKIKKAQKRDNEYLKHEYRMIKLLQANHIVELKDYVIKNKEFYIVMERCDENLEDYIFEQKKKFWDNKNQQKTKEKIEKIHQEAINIISQILAGYWSLLKKHIIHRDLNPENILITENMRIKTIKISGFSSSRTLQNYKNNQQVTQNGGTNYKSPQQSTNNYTSKCDIYAIGVMFFELVAGFGITSVYSGPKRTEIYVQQPNYPFIGFDCTHINQEIQQFIIKCLKYEEADRIEWELVYKDPIFEGTILTTDKSIIEEISKIDFYLNPYNQIAKTIKTILQEESKKSKSKREKKEKKAISKLENSQQEEETQHDLPIQRKLDVMLNSIGCAKRKCPELIRWPLFYREMLKIHNGIPPYMISRVFCLIDEKSQGWITKKELKNWVDTQRYYTYGDIMKNTVLGCIDKISWFFLNNSEEILENKLRDEKDFFKFFMENKIDEEVGKETIKSIYEHFTCNQKKNQCQTGQRFIEEDYEIKDVVSGQNEQLNNLQMEQ